MSEKRCAKCGRLKPLDDFHLKSKDRQGSGKDHVAQCKSCVHEQYNARPTVEPAMHGYQKCRDCERTLHVTAFPKHKRYKNGRHSYCLDCHAARARKYRAENSELVAERKRTIGKSAELRRHYGITLEQFESMLEEQGGVCAICGMTPDENGRHLCVDHDHSCCSGRKRSCGKCIRGLLCMNCNRAIGWLNDDPALADRAAKYLRSRGVG